MTSIINSLVSVMVWSNFFSLSSPPPFLPPPSQDAVYAAMAVREREEERTQRLMIALNETRVAFPGHSCEEVEEVVRELGAAVETHRSEVASFWLTLLDNPRRRQVRMQPMTSHPHLLHTFMITISVLHPHTLTLPYPH